jgi:RNA polymerase sigma factor (sigma-70 family)
MVKAIWKEGGPLDAEGQERVRSRLYLAEVLAVRQFRDCEGAVPLEELLGEASLALADAASRFDESAGVPFGAYATRVIRHRLNGVVTAARRRKHLICACFSELCTGGRRLPPDPPCRWAREPHEELDRREEERATRALLKRVRKALSPLGFTLLELYYAKEYTLEEIGRKLGRSRERVRQLLVKALAQARVKGHQGGKNRVSRLGGALSSRGRVEE